MMLLLVQGIQNSVCGPNVGTTCFLQEACLNVFWCLGGTSNSLGVEEDPDNQVHFTFTPSTGNDLLSAPSNPNAKRISV